MSKSEYERPSNQNEAENEEFDLKLDNKLDDDELSPKQDGAEQSKFIDDSVPISSFDSNERVLSTPRFGRPTCRNVIMAVLFSCTSLGVVWLESVNLGKYTSAHERPLLVFASIASALLGVGALVVWVWVTRLLLWVSQIVTVVLVLVLALIYFLAGKDSASMVCVIVAAGMVHWLYVRREKREFAGVMFETVSELAQNQPILLVAALAVLAVQMVWLAFFAISSIQALTFEHYGTLYAYLVLAFFWTTQVMKHVVHATAAGCISPWYFKCGDARNAATLCLKRVLWTSLGAVCYGSLLVVPIRYLWIPFKACTPCCTTNPSGLPGSRLYRWTWSCLYCLCYRMHEIVHSLYHNFNKYAFYQVVMYSKDFRSASQDVSNNFTRRGVEAIVEQDQVVTLLAFPSIGGGCFIASVIALWARHLNLQNWFELSVITFWVGFSILSLTTEIIDACVSTLYACFAEEPRHLNETHPTLFLRFARIAEFSAITSLQLDSPPPTFVL